MKRLLLILAAIVGHRGHRSRTDTMPADPAGTRQVLDPLVRPGPDLRGPVGQGNLTGPGTT